MSIELALLRDDGFRGADGLELRPSNVVARAGNSREPALRGLGKSAAKRNASVGVRAVSGRFADWPKAVRLVLHDAAVESRNPHVRGDFPNGYAYRGAF